MKERPEQPKRWQQQAACRGVSNTFFPVMGESKIESEIREKRAKLLCEQCVVIKPCLEASLMRDEHGVWAGTTREDRRVMRRNLMAG